MRSINISDPVWEAIAERGKFGETEDDVLRRIFKIAPSQSSLTESSRPTTPPGTQRRFPRKSFATHRMSSYISANLLHVSFQGGVSRSWPLPDKNDKVTLVVIRRKAVEFAKEHGATIGQVNAVKKSLTEAGYHLTK